MIIVKTKIAATENIMTKVQLDGFGSVGDGSALEEKYHLSKLNKNTESGKTEQEKVFF